MSHFERLRNTGPQKATPLPKFQLFILLYLEAAMLITSFVVFPFINQLVYEYGITHGDEKKVGYYAGTMNALFYLTETIFVVYCGRASDRIGRRPALLAGLGGLALSITLFGISKTFLTLAVSRALTGALNGTMGVIKGMLAEITDETNQAQAFSFTPLVFAVVTSVASFIGGGLSHPYERIPGAFGWSKFWKAYPYSLPCFVSGLLCVSAFTIAFLWLKESLNLKPQDKMNGRSTSADSAIVDENPTATTALISTPLPLPPSMREVLNPRVRMAILSHGTIALLSIVFIFLQPLVLSTPIPLGGLGLDPPTIGLILGLNGIISGIFQIVFFARLHGRFGTRTIFMGSLVSYFILYISWPLMSFLVKRRGKIDAKVGTILAIQQVTNAVAGMGFSCAHIFVASAAPTRNALGTTAGLSQSLASLMRAVGPVVTSSLFSFSLQRNLLGGKLVYIVLVFLVLIALAISSRLPHVITRASDERGD